MQHNPIGTTAKKRQPENQRLGAVLDESEFAQIEREVMFGRAPHLSYQLEDGTCAPDCADCAHRDLRRRYQNAARSRVRRRSIPRLPAGTGNDVRAIRRASRDALKDARGVYHGAQRFGSSREMIDAACEFEFRERVFEAHELTFMTRVYAELDAEQARYDGAHERAFKRAIIGIPKSATTLPPRFAKAGPQ